MDFNLSDIGNKILVVRNSKNITQKEISAVIGIDQSTFSNLENGKYDIPITVLIKLSEYLNISIVWLLGIDSIPELTDSERLDIEKFKRFIISIREN